MILLFLTWYLIGLVSIAYVIYLDYKSGTDTSLGTCLLALLMAVLGLFTALAVLIIAVDTYDISFKFTITNNLFQINVYKLKLKKLKIYNSVWIENSKTNQLALPTLFKRILN